MKMRRTRLDVGRKDDKEEAATKVFDTMIRNTSPKVGEGCLNCTRIEEGRKKKKVDRLSGGWNGNRQNSTHEDQADSRRKKLRIPSRQNQKKTSQKIDQEQNRYQKNFSVEQNFLEIGIRIEEGEGKGIEGTKDNQIKISGKKESRRGIR
ncbi:hypothetical protein Tco_0863939 [Tanacetum coccineum]